MEFVAEEWYMELSGLFRVETSLDTIIDKSNESGRNHNTAAIYQYTDKRLESPSQAYSEMSLRDPRI